MTTTAPIDANDVGIPNDAMFVTDLEHDDSSTKRCVAYCRTRCRRRRTRRHVRAWCRRASRSRRRRACPSNVPLLSRRIARPGTPDPHHQSPRFRSMSKLRVTLPPEASQSMVVEGEDADEDAESIECAQARSPRPNGKLAGSMRPPTALSPFIGSFEASLLAGRMSNAQTNVFHGFSAQLVVSGRELFGEHMRLDFDASYCVVDAESDVALPYVSDIELPKSGYEVPPKGIVQLTLLQSVAHADQDVSGVVRRQRHAAAHQDIYATAHFCRGRRRGTARRAQVCRASQAVLAASQALLPVQIRARGVSRFDSRIRASSWWCDSTCHKIRPISQCRASRQQRQRHQRQQLQQLQQHDCGNAVMSAASSSSSSSAADGRRIVERLHIAIGFVVVVGCMHLAHRSTTRIDRRLTCRRRASIVAWTSDRVLC
jgi:hypothetical protein